MPADNNVYEWLYIWKLKEQPHNTTEQTWDFDWNPIFPSKLSFYLLSRAVSAWRSFADSGVIQTSEDAQYSSKYWYINCCAALVLIEKKSVTIYSYDWYLAYRQALSVAALKINWPYHII